MTPWLRPTIERTAVAGASLELEVDALGTIRSVRVPSTAIADLEPRWVGCQLVKVLSAADRKQAVRLILGVTSTGRRSYGVWHVDLGFGPEPLSIAAEQDRTSESVIFTGLRMADVSRELEDLSDRAFQDGLTGLCNRSLFLEHLNRELLRSSRTGSAVAVVVADVNHLKQVNDTYGHAVGDALLVEVARRLTAACRPADVPARLSGDEFAVLCPDLSGSTDPSVIVRRLEALTSGPAVIAGYPLDIGVAIGCAVAPTSEATEEDALELLHRADVSMYAAKASGRA